MSPGRNMLVSSHSFHNDLAHRVHPRSHVNWPLENQKRRLVDVIIDTSAVDAGLLPVRWALACRERSEGVAQT